MKKSLFIIASIILMFYGCSTDKRTSNEVSDTIDVTIEQGGNSINIIDDTAEIRRTKFSIKFRFVQPDGVLINASFHPETFNNAKEGLPLNELRGFKNTVISGEPFNRDGAISLSSDSPNYWYYADDTDHRFNNVLKNENGYLCTNEISGIIDTDETVEKIDFNRIKQNEIYLVIIKIEWNKDYTKMIEKNRKMIKLKFII